MTYVIGDFAKIKAPKPLPSGNTVKVRVRVWYFEDDGWIVVRSCTPGLYNGAVYRVVAEELEAAP